MNLFSFGTLMDPELLSVVCGHDLESVTREPASVTDHVPLWVVDDHYPVLVPRKGTNADGIIIRGLSAHDIDRIIFFEGGEFNVRQITVVNASGEQEAVSYFAHTQNKAVSDQVWLLEHWRRDTKPHTMPRVHRYMACYGRMDVHEADAYW